MGISIPISNFCISDIPLVSKNRCLPLNLCYNNVLMRMISTVQSYIADMLSTILNVVLYMMVHAWHLCNPSFSTVVLNTPFFKTLIPILFQVIFNLLVSCSYHMSQTLFLPIVLTSFLIEFCQLDFICTFLLLHISFKSTC